MAYVTEDDLLDLLKAHAQDNLYLGREQSSTALGDWPYGWRTLRGDSSHSPNRNSGTTIPRSRLEHLTILQEA